MKQYIIKRLLLIIFTLFGLITITFMVARVAPGDPARVAAGPDATEEMVQTLRHPDAESHRLCTVRFLYPNQILGDFIERIIP